MVCKIKKNLLYKNQGQNPSIKNIRQMRTWIDTTQRKNKKNKSMGNKEKKTQCK